jgi:hypothetical protein
MPASTCVVAEIGNAKEAESVSYLTHGATNANTDQIQHLPQRHLSRPLLQPKLRQLLQQLELLTPNHPIPGRYQLLRQTWLTTKRTGNICLNNNKPIQRLQK